MTRVEYKKLDWQSKESVENQSVADFLYDEILWTETSYGDDRKIPLEEQPKVVCEAIGRLVERLLEKGVFNLEDLKYVSKCDWGRKADTLQIKKEEE